MNKTIVYVESLNYLGHGETQQKLYIRAMLELQWKVILLTPPPHKTNQWSNNLSSSIKDNLFISLLEKPPKKGFKKKLKWLWLNNQISKAEKQSGWKADLVLISWMDGMRVTPFEALIARLTFKYKWAGLYFKPAHFRSDVKMKWIKKRKRILADNILMRSPNCRGIGVFEKDMNFTLTQKKNYAPIIFFPETTETKTTVIEEIENIRLLADKRCVFGLLGDLSPRKGVTDFLRIAYEFDAKKAFFLLVGNLDISKFHKDEQREITQLLNTKGRDNLYLKLTRIDPLEFNALVSICDILYLSYKNHYHSSGILAKAALFKKPVIVSAGYCMGERVKKYNLGLTVNGDVYSEKFKAVEMFANTDFRNAITKTAGFVNYSEQNSTKALKNALQQLIYQATSGDNQ